MGVNIIIFFVFVWLQAWEQPWKSIMLLNQVALPFMAADMTPTNKGNNINSDGGTSVDAKWNILLANIFTAGSLIPTCMIHFNMRRQTNWQQVETLQLLFGLFRAPQKDQRLGAGRLKVCSG